MPNITLAQLEDNVLTALEALSYLRTRKSYQGELDVETADQVVFSAWPAALVFIESAQFTPVSSDGLSYLWTPRPVVFVGDENWRGEAERRRGGVAPGEVGTYQMIHDVLDALAGKTFGLDIGRLAPVDLQPVLASQSLSVYRIAFQFTDVPYQAVGD
jgi:phage gp37-like protein